MRLSIFTLIAALGFFVAGLQSPQPTQAEANRYVATGDLIVRDAPPIIWRLYYPGKQVGILKKAQGVVVDDQRRIKDLFAEQEWLKVRDSEGKLAGWVYNGTTESGERYLVPQSHSR